MKDSQYCILLGGYPGAGKTTVGSLFTKNHNFIFLDKDTICDKFTNFITEIKTGNSNDRHSDFYQNKLRPLEYEITIDIAIENFKLGNNIIVVTPFTSEFTNSIKLENLKSSFLSLNPKAKVISIAIINDLEENRKRMTRRKRSEDDWKLDNWISYAKKIKNRDYSATDLVLNNVQLNDTLKEMEEFIWKY